MTVARQSIRWFFAREQPLKAWWPVIVWWELRRIPFNLSIGAYGIVCLGLFYWAILSSGTLQPGEDAVEPLALMAAPFLVNICYTCGWLVELLARRARPSLSPRFGPWLLKLGLTFSLLVISGPAVYWLIIVLAK